MYEETASLSELLTSSESPSKVADRRSQTALDPQRLSRVVAFVAQHLEDDITVEKLADLACLSQFHFARAFKTAVGKSPHQYVSEKRIEQAMAQLASGESPLRQIALTCGFSSHANFSRAFRRATGLTPGQYRALARLRRASPSLSGTAA
ncbi:MAG TPA: AraC family transcriptional regulator [Methylovirgula sp.]|nr:AraC family transcriptional regulator [Methylovirgula sp.]